MLISQLIVPKSGPCHMISHFGEITDTSKMPHGCFIDEQNSKFWYKNGLLDKNDGPAVEYPDGNKFWYHKSHLHRLDGPAVEYVDGVQEWWYHGTKINCYSQEEFEKLINLKAFW